MGKELGTDVKPRLSIGRVEQLLQSSSKRGEFDFTYHGECGCTGSETEENYFEKLEFWDDPQECFKTIYYCTECSYRVFTVVRDLDRGSRGN